MESRSLISEQLLYANREVYKRNDGRFYCRIPLAVSIDENYNKKYKYKTIYGVDKNEVHIKSYDFIKDMLCKDEEDRTYHQLFTTKIERWLYTYKFLKIKPSSFDRLEETYSYQIIPALKENGLEKIAFKDVKLEHIEQIISYSFEKGYSYSTLLKARNFLKEVFNFYEDECAKNPMAKYIFYKKENVIQHQENLKSIKKKVEEKIEMEKSDMIAYGYSKQNISNDERLLATLKLESQEDQSDISFFASNEIDKIKETIQNGYSVSFKSRSGNPVKSAHYNVKQGDFFLFMLYSGIRCGEAVALQYSDFDYEKSTVSITRNATRFKERKSNGQATGKITRNIGSVKTSNSRATIFVSEKAINIIKKMQSSEPTGYQGYILHNDSYQPISANTLNRRFQRLLRGAAINARGIHSLRHTFATILYDQTHDLKLVSQQLRHSDAAFTARTYVHLTNEKTLETLNSIQF